MAEIFEVLEQLADNKLIVGLILSVIVWMVFQRKHEQYKDMRERYKNSAEPNDELKQLVEQNDSAGLRDYYKNLSDQSKRPQEETNATVYREYLTYLKQPQHQTRYQQALHALNNFLSRFLDKRPFTPNYQQPRHFFTESSYAFCLRLAFVYPIVLLLISWCVGEVGKVGELVLLSEVTQTHKFFTIGALLLMAFCYYRSTKPASKRSKLWVLAGSSAALASAASLAGTSAAIAAAATLTAGIGAGLAGAGALAVAVAKASTIAVAVAAAGAVAVAVTATDDGTVASIDVVTIIGIGAFGVTHTLNRFIDFYDDKMEKRRGLFWASWVAFFTLYSMVAIILALTFGGANKLEFVALPIFFGILPLLNSVIDWCSLNASRYLFAKLSTGKHTWYTTLGLVVVDIILAIGFMLLITSVLIGVLSITNVLAQTFVAKNAFDFAVIMEDLSNPHELANMFWVHGMLLSTIIPTFVHFVFVAFALCFAFLWHKNPKFIDDFYAYPDVRIQLHSKIWQARILTGVITLAVIGILYFGLTHFTTPLEWLWHYADGLLQLLDSSYVTPVITQEVIEAAPKQMVGELEMETI